MVRQRHLRGWPGGTLRISRLSLLLCALSACSGSEHTDGGSSASESEPDAGDEELAAHLDGEEDAASQDSLDGGTSTDVESIDALSLDPPSATLRVSASPPATLQFKALGSRYGSAPQPVAATYTLDTSGPGAIDPPTGVFTSNNRAGGVVNVTASYQGKQATATLTVVLEVEEMSGSNLAANPGTLFEPAQNQVITADAAHAPSLIYPVAETMFPQNLAHVLFQWRSGGAKLFQLAFHSNVLDYKIYTDGVQETCSKAGTQGACWQSDENAWRKLAESNAGQAVSLTVRSTDPAHPGTVYEAPAVTLHFSKRRVPGAIYYWSTTAKGVRRGRMNDLTPSNFLTPNEADGNCVACHTLSRNGRAMAADVGGEKLWVVDVTKEVPPPRRFTAYGGKAIANSWATFNPDTTRVVSSTNGILTLRDGQTGAPIGPSGGVIALNKALATMPDWAPDGARLVFAMGPGAKGRKATAASIAQLSVTGDVFGSPQVIVASTGSSDDNSWPMFDPTSQWIAFVKSKASSEKDPTAQVNVVRAQAAATPQPLTRANTLVNDQTIATGLYNNMPTWAPTDEGGLEWVAFTSTRDYGVVLANGSSFGDQRRQLWIAALEVAKLGTSDPSYPAFRVPFQELSEDAHRPFWAQDALVNEDGGTPDTDAGVPSDPPDAGAPGDAGGSPDAGSPCRAEGADCATGTCCGGLYCGPVGDNYQCQVEIL